MEMYKYIKSEPKHSNIQKNKKYKKIFKELYHNKK